MTKKIFIVPTSEKRRTKKAISLGLSVLRKIKIALHCGHQDGPNVLWASFLCAIDVSE